MEFDKKDRDTWSRIENLQIVFGGTNLNHYFLQTRLFVESNIWNDYFE